MRRCVALAAFLAAVLYAGLAGATPTYTAKLTDPDRTDVSGGSTASSYTDPVAVQPASDIALLACVSFRHNALAGAQVNSVIFDPTGANLPFVKAGSVNNNTATQEYRQEAWYLLDPTETLDNVVTTFNLAPTGGVRITIHQYAGVHSIGATQTASGTGTALSIGITTLANNSWAAACAESRGNDTAPFTPGAGDNERTDGITGGAIPSNNDLGFWDADTDAAVAGPHTISAASPVSDQWAMVALELQAIPAPTPTGTDVGMLSFIGVGRVATTGGGGGGGGDPACTVSIAAGSTRAQIQSAIDGAPDGAVICPASAQIVAVTTPLVMNCTSRELTFDGNGSTADPPIEFNQSGGVVVWRSTGTIQNVTNVSSKTTTGGNAVLTLAAAVPSTWAGGDIVIFTAEDVLPHAESNRKMGERMRILSKSGSDLTLTGVPEQYSNYTTQMRVGKIGARPCIVRDIRVDGDTSLTATSSVPNNVVEGVALVDGVFQRVRLRDTRGGAIQTIGSWNTAFRDIDARNILPTQNADGSSNGSECIHSRSSNGTVADGYFCEDAGHGVDSHTSVPGSLGSLINYGNDFDQINRNGVCNRVTGACVGGHSGQYAALAEDVFALGGGRPAGLRGQLSTFRRVCAIAPTAPIQLGVNPILALSNTFDRFVSREHGITGSTLVISLLSGSTGNAFQNSQLEAVTAWSIPGAVSLTGTIARQSVASHVDTWTTDDGPPVPGTGFTTSGGSPVTSGDDLLCAGQGADTVNALAGADTIFAGPGNDALTGGSGRDRFVYQWTDEGSDTISDFSVGPTGDILDVSLFLARAAGADYDDDPFADGYVRVLQSGGNTLLQLDNNGGGDGYTTVATLTGITATAIVFVSEFSPNDNWRIRQRGN